MSDSVVVGIGAASSATTRECLGAIARVVRPGWTIAALSTVEEKLVQIRPVADALGVELVLWPVDRLRLISVPHPSARAMSETGSPSVAEAAAILASRGGELVVAKTSSGSVSVAVACVPD